MQNRRPETVGVIPAYPNRPRSEAPRKFEGNSSMLARDSSRARGTTSTMSAGDTPSGRSTKSTAFPVSQGIRVPALVTSASTHPPMTDSPAA